ncbi:MAG: aldo/keto reductase [Chloroflexi bacterium]|nr:aldo/keto reductase [Chloroflexota bacterium]
MKYRKLGPTGLNIAEIAFGVWTVSTGWWGQMTETEGAALLEKALYEGINFYDTADTYGEGLGETILARAFPKKRHEIIIATKFGYDFYNFQARAGHRERPQNFTPQFIHYACEQSLKRLKTDYIDLYQLHIPRMEHIRNDEIFATLEDLVHEGKIRNYGFALGPDIGWFDEGAAAMRERQAKSVQIIYSLLEPDPGRAFFPVAQETRAGLLARVPHASEILTDKFVEIPTFEPGDHRALRRAQWLRQAMEKRKHLLFLAQGTGRTLAQAAIKFCMAQPTIAAVLPNITSEADLKEYTAASDAPDLTADELARTQELLEHNYYLEEGHREEFRSSQTAPSPTGIQG